MPHRFDRKTPLLIPKPLARQLLKLYDYPDPRRPGKMIRGYDRFHALRTARLCADVALRLGHDADRVTHFQIACLLHDLGRAGLDRKLFGEIWSWAREREIPTRPREWRAVHPHTPYGHETEAFIVRYGAELAAAGIVMDEWACEQVEMRLGYAGRLGRCLRSIRPQLTRMGIRWKPWMEIVMLYYYYPEKLSNVKPWVRQLGEILVACEQFEAYNNRQRGSDYYTRQKETLSEAFAYLAELTQEGILSETVVSTLREMAAEGRFDGILAEARGRVLTANEVRMLRGLRTGVA
ncbi:MAG: hypothetical protein V1495_02020 [Pseudomonadota bacterium]